MFLHNTNTQLFDKLENYVVRFVICSSVMMMYNEVLLRGFHCKTNQMFLLLNILVGTHNIVIVEEKEEEQQEHKDKKDTQQL